MKNYINLITHSYYTFLHSSLSIARIIEFAKTHNLNYASLVDVNVMYGSIEFYKACIDNNLKPIIGLQINYHHSDLVLIAKNANGYKTLLKLSSCIMTNQEVVLEQYLTNDTILIKLNGEFDTKFSNYFVCANNLANSVACFEANYYDENDFQTLQIVNAIRNDDTLKNIENISIKANKLLTPEEYQNTFEINALNNLEKIVNSINLELNFANNNGIIEYPNLSRLSSQEYLCQLATSGLKQYLNQNPTLQSANYYERLNFELEIIKSKNFADYFLVVQDFINYAKRNKIIIGPGRGSAAGSLIAFCLNITEVDPIKYNLLFERFLNIERVSMPDIDTDVMDIKRDTIINYLFEKYGTNHVAQIITFSKIKIKQAIRDIGRILNVNTSIINKICKNIKLEYEDNFFELLEKPTKDKNLITLQNDYKQHHEIFVLARQIIGFPRQSGTHAAGIVVSKQNITDIVAIQNSQNNHIMTQTSMDYLEELGLIKIDILGLRNLTIINNILKLIAFTQKKNINLQTINLHDENVFKLFQTGKTEGIFQFESAGMKKILKAIYPHSIEDLSIASALFRPGANSHIEKYLENRRLNNTKYMNNDIKEILAPTYGIIIYQEQIIKLVQIVANFDKFKADNFRKAISKKKEDLILKVKDEFIANAVKNNYTNDQAEQLFADMVMFASYGFNHSHSLSYAFISYWIAFLKCYYPLESFSVFLSNISTDKAKLNTLIEESKQFGIQIDKPNINLSSTSFTLLKNKILFSFNSINGLGIETAKKIIELRNKQPNQMFNDPLIAIAKLSEYGINKTVLSNLIKSGAFDALNNNRNYLLQNLEILTNKTLNLLDNDDNFIMQPSFNDVLYDDSNYANYEIEALSIAFSESQIQKWFKEYKSEFKLSSLNDSNKQITNCLVQIKSYTPKVSRNNSNYLHVEFYENNNLYKASIFNDLDNWKTILKTNSILIVTINTHDKGTRFEKCIKVLKSGE